MAQNFRKFVDGINIVPKTSSTVNSAGDLDFDTTANKLNLNNGSSSSPVVTESHSATLTNKVLSGNTASNLINGSGTLNLNSSGTITVPNATDTLVGKATTDILTNKTIDAASNTISNLTNSNLSGSAAISNANLAQMAAHTFKGNNTGSSAVPSDLTATQLTAELNNFVGDSGSGGTKGLVPAPAAGDAAANKFLKADGSWATTPDTGVTSIGTIDSQTKSANGAVITGSSLVMQTADASNPGLVSTGSQTLAGAKTFSTSVATPTINDNGAGLSINSSSNQNITIAPAGTGRLKLNAPEGVEMQQIATPANPSSGANSLYFKSDNNLYSLTSGGAETLIGSGGGSAGINFLTLDTSFQSTKPNNSNFESTVGDWVSYNNNSGTIAQSLTDNSTVNTVDPARWFGQSFVPSVSASISTVAFKLSKTGTISGNMVVKIYDDSAGNPNSVIGTSDAINANTLTGSATVTTFTFSTPPSLTGGNTYYAILDNSSVSVSIGNALLVSVDNTQPYASGTEYFTLNSGSSWSTATNDLYFDIQSTATALTLTGGSPTITVSRTTTSGEVLDGVASLKVVKSAANSQNQGISCVANVPLGYRGQVISIQLPFKVISGSLVDGDIVGLVYDITNSQIITPTNNSASNGLLKMTFPMPTNTTQIRFGINFATTSTSAVTYSIDDVVIGPQEVVFGPSMTDWQPATGYSFGNAFGTVSSYEFFEKQIGDSLQVKGTFTTGTTAANTNSYIQLRTGLAIDTTKLPSTGGRMLGLSAGTEGVAVFGSVNGRVLYYNGSNADRIYFATDGSSSIDYVAATGNAKFNTGEVVPVDFTIPVVGLSTNVVQQNAGMFSIASYLANGTRVTGSAPTALGQYRSYLRSSSTYSEVNGAPTITPTSTDGIYMYNSGAYNVADSSNQPSKYDIFIGKNKNYQINAYQTTGRSGAIDITNYSFGTSQNNGLCHEYNPATGVLTVCMSIQNAGASFLMYAGRSADGASNYSNAYFDIFVSDQVVPVQVSPVASSALFLGGNGHGSSGTTVRLYTGVTNTGLALLGVNDATDGSYVEVQEDGVYTIDANDVNSGAPYSLGVTIDSSQLSTNIASIAAPTNLGRMVGDTGFPVAYSKTLRLLQGQIIRLQDDGSLDGTSDVDVQLRVTKVSN